MVRHTKTKSKSINFWYRISNLVVLYFNWNILKICVTFVKVTVIMRIWKNKTPEVLNLHFIMVSLLIQRYFREETAKWDDNCNTEKVVFDDRIIGVFLSVINRSKTNNVTVMLTVDRQIIINPYSSPGLIMTIYCVKHFVLLLFAILYIGHFSHLKFPDFDLILFSSHKKHVQQQGLLLA